MVASIDAGFSYCNFCLTREDCKNIGRSSFFGTKTYLNIVEKKIEIIRHQFIVYKWPTEKIQQNIESIKKDTKMHFDKKTRDLNEKTLKIYEISSIRLNVFQRIGRCLCNAFSSTHLNEVGLIFKESKNKKMNLLVSKELKKKFDVGEPNFKRCFDKIQGVILKKYEKNQLNKK
jgi:hypothetical protein